MQRLHIVMEGQEKNFSTCREGPAVSTTAERSRKIMAYKLPLDSAIK